MTVEDVLPIKEMIIFDDNKHNNDHNDEYDNATIKEKKNVTITITMIMTKLTMKMKMRMTIILTKPTINQMSVTHLGSIHLLKFLFTSIGCLSGY